MLTTSIYRIRERCMPSGSLGDRVLCGVSWSLAGSAAQLGAGMVISVICGRLLGSQGFGELSMVRNTALLLAGLAGSGLGTAATKLAAELRSVDQTRMGRLIGNLTAVCGALGCVMTVICLCLSGPIASYGLNASDLAPSIQMISIIIPFQMLQGLQTGILSGFESFRSLARLIIIDTVAALAVVPFGIMLFGLNGAICGYVVVAALGCLTRWLTLSSKCLQDGITVRLDLRLPELGLLWSGTTPLVVLWIVWQSCDWLARLPLAHQTGGYSELGVFTAAMSLCSVVIFLPQQVSSVGFPILANLLGTGDRQGFRQTMRAMWLYTGVAAVLTALPFILLSKVVMNLYGAEYVDGWPAMAVLLCAIAMNGVARVPAHMLIASGQAWLHCMITVLWGAILCTAAVLLSDRGALGLALAYALAHLIYLVLHAVASGRALRKLGNDARIRA
jgi:O-antigen/teichoic acid export membrane protein